MRRRLTALVALLFVGALCAVLAIGQTRQRPALRPGETWGIDVSHHQGETTGRRWRATA